MNSTVEDWRHVPHMVDMEHRVQKFALFAMSFPYSKNHVKTEHFCIKMLLTVDGEKIRTKAQFVRPVSQRFSVLNGYVGRG